MTHPVPRQLSELLNAFVWADHTDADFASTAPAQFLIRAAGGVGIGTNSPSEQLTVAGTVESTSGGFKFPDGTVQATAATGGSSGGGQIHCSENDNCQGQVVACWFRGDDSDGGLGRIRFDELAFPIQFGTWSNAPCGTSGTGWHVVGVGTCQTGTGSGSKGCQAVIVLT